MTAANTIRANGFVELATTHEAAQYVWQGKDFGQRLTRGAPVEQWETEAGMDFKIQRAKVRFATSFDQAASEWAEFPDQHVLLRSDTKAPMGIVSAGYKIVQPGDILRTIAHEARQAGFELETAGTLHGGRVFWAMASDGTECEIGTGDKILSRTLLSTSCDGTRATRGHKTTIAVVCSNTMRAAIAAGTEQFKLSHRSKYDKDRAAHALGLVHDSEGFAAFATQAKRLADKQVSALRAERIAFDLLAPANVAKAPSLEEIQKVTDSRAYKKILALFGGEGMGATMDGRKGTAWGFLNACTEYADHHARATSEENRMDSAWFGAGDKLKTKALELVAAL